MSNTVKILLFVLGGVVLLAIGFAVGFFLLRVPLAARQAAVPGPVGMMPFAYRGLAVRGFQPALRFPFLGLGLLVGPLQCLGSIAGFVALFLVLTRKPASAVATPAAPVAIATPAAESTAPAGDDKTAASQPTKPG